MIITKQKEFEEIITSVDKGPAFIMGCNECATLCHTGGEEEVLAMKGAFEKKNIQVSGWIVLEPACHRNNDRRLLKLHKDALEKSKSILVLACGNGVQTISGLFDDKDVISGNDTLFLGEIVRANEFDKRCNMCGECILNLFDGFCPVSRCPKSMLNGPCGGAIDGKCEVNSELDCIWISIYKRLKKRGKLHQLEEIKKPKDWSKSLEMKRRL
jgi:ferredoxin